MPSGYLQPLSFLKIPVTFSYKSTRIREGLYLETSQNVGLFGMRSVQLYYGGYSAHQDLSCRERGPGGGPVDKGVFKLFDCPAQKDKNFSTKGVSEGA